MKAISITSTRAFINLNMYTHGPQQASEGHAKPQLRLQWAVWDAAAARPLSAVWLFEQLLNTSLAQARQAPRLYVCLFVGNGSAEYMVSSLWLAGTAAEPRLVFSLTVVCDSQNQLLQFCQGARSWSRGRWLAMSYWTAGVRISAAGQLLTF